MPNLSRQKQYEVRADFDADTIVVYQAFPHAVADAALTERRFVAPFSFHRMTWVKPSFCWLMERSNWGTKSGQERILAVRVRRSGWDEALSLGVLTHPERKIHKTPEHWEKLFETATVHVQWDPERTFRGAVRDCYAIQVGISRHLIERYVNDWVVEISDRTPEVRKMQALLRGGKADRAALLLPRERIYPVAAVTAKRLGMD